MDADAWRHGGRRRRLRGAGHGRVTRRLRRGRLGGDSSLSNGQHVVTCAAVLERIGELIPAESKEQLHDLPEGLGPEDARIEGETAVVTVPGARLPIRLVDSERGWLITADTTRQLLELER